MAVYVRAIVLAILLSGQAHAAFRQPCSQPKRYPYPIIVNPDLQVEGFGIVGFQAWTFRQGAWQRAALQIDEKNKFGEYVLADGLPFTANTDDGRLDGNDEIVVIGRELGDDFTNEDLKKGPFADALKLWKVTFCGGDSTYGTMALVFFSTPFPSTAKPKARFDLTEKEIRTNRYRYRFNEKHPVLLGQVFLQRGDTEVPILANSVFRMAFKLPWWLPDFTLTEDNFKSSIESWQVGPIRTIVAVGVKLRNLLSIFDFHMFSELVFYEDYFQIPTVLEFPDSPKEFLRPGSGLTYGVGLVDQKNVAIESNIELLPNSPEDLAKRLNNRRDVPYLSNVRGPWGELAIQVVITTDNQKAAPVPYRLTQEMFGETSLSKDWDWLSDMKGDLGLFVDISKVEKGTYNFRLDLRLDSKADQGLHTAFAYPEAEWVTQSLP